MTDGASDQPSRTLEERIESVYRQRALQLAKQPADGVAARSTLTFIVFWVSAERYGLEMNDVSEVIRTVPITPVPGAPPRFAGVISLRGEIRPVLNLKHLLGMPASERKAPGSVILLRPVVPKADASFVGPPEQRIGIQVDRVEEVREVRPAELGPLDGRIPRIAARYLKAHTPSDFMLLNSHTLFAELLKESLTA